MYEAARLTLSVTKNERVPPKRKGGREEGLPRCEDEMPSHTALKRRGEQATGTEVIERYRAT